MEPPPIPPDEPERLEALRRYDVLDSEPEAAYDETTALAALICEAPFSLITLVDEDRQWFKSRHGWHSKESDRAISFCAHAVHQPDASELMVVCDAAGDQRFSDNPFVTGEPGVRFYAGTPLVSPEGHAVGTLCVLDRVPRELTPDQEQALRVLGTHVMTLLELRRSKRRRDLSDEIINSLPGVFYLFNEEGQFLRWNRRLEEVTGYSPDEVAQLHPLDLFQGADRAHIEERIRAVFEKGEADAEADLVSKAGAGIPHYFTGRKVTLGGEPCLIGTGIDLSQRREAEVERDRLFNLSPDPLCVVGFDGRFHELNPAWKRVLGHDPRELMGRPFMDLVHPDDVERTREELKRNQGGSGTRTFENRYRCRDGSWRWLSWNSNVDTETGLIYAVARDVTTRIEVADALRKSEERYRTLVESARDAILTLGPDGTIRSTNQAFETITGWKEEEWLGRPYEEILHPDDRALGREMFGKLGRDEAMPVFEVRVAAAEGTHVPVEVTVAAFEPEPGERWALLVGRDIRSRKALDERLQRIQRLDAVGRLAAGVAHDFRNVLTVVRGEAELLAGEEDLSQEVEDGVHQIRVAAEQGVDLTERLLALSRKRHVRLEKLELNQVVDGFGPMLDRLIRSPSSLQVVCGSGPTTVRGDSRMLEQCLMNLVLNSRDAMPEGGTVTISTERIGVDEERAARFPDARAGPYVRLSVSDTGTGISAEDLPQIFEPLFTTKEEGQGTGLGLATVYSIVRQHEGWMDVVTEPGEGTTFHIHLPAAG